MAAVRGALVRCGGKWTQAKFNSFIKNNLRSATRKWGPIQDCKKRAHVSRGIYKCECCGAEVPPTIFDEDKRKRMKNIFVDHTIPIIDPAVGFTTWDDCIERMFCEPENLQLICKDCHTIKSREEIEIAKKRRAASKEKQLDFEEGDNDDE